MTDQHCLLCKQCAALAELCATTAVCRTNSNSAELWYQGSCRLCQENRMCMIVTVAAHRCISNRTSLSDVWVRFLPASFFFFKLPPPLTVTQQVHYVRYHAHTEEKLPGYVSNFYSGEKNSWNVNSDLSLCCRLSYNIRTKLCHSTYLQ